MSANPPRVWVLALCLLVAAAACGGSDETGDGADADGGTSSTVSAGAPVPDACPETLEVGAPAESGATPVVWRQDLALGDLSAPGLGFVVDGVVVVNRTQAESEFAVGIDVVTGEILWCAPGALSAPNSEQPYAAGGPFLVRVQRDESSREVVALDPATGEPRWTVEGPLAYDVGGNDSLVVVAGTEGSSDVKALSLDDGSTLWTHEPDVSACATDEVVAVGDPGEIVGLSAADGSELWTVDDASLYCFEGTGYFSDGGLGVGSFVVHDIATGQPLVEVPEDTAVRHFVDGDLMVVSDTDDPSVDTLTAYRLDGSGDVAWTTQIDTATTDGLYGSEYVDDRYVVAVNGVLSVYDLRTGDRLSEVAIEEEGASVEAVVGDTVVLVYLDADPVNTVAVSATTGEVLWTLDDIAPIWSTVDGERLFFADESVVLAVDVATG